MIGKAIRSRNGVGAGGSDFHGAVSYVTRKASAVWMVNLSQHPSPGGAAHPAATREGPRAPSRMYAIAHALQGKSRAEAAWLAGMERQALHEAVVRYNTEGLVGLHDRPKGRRRPVLDEAEGLALRQLVLAGPDLARHGRTEWTLPALAEEIAYLWG